MGVSESLRRSVAETKRNEQAGKVIQILNDNKEGLTSLQIATLMGDRLRKETLWRLKKEGKIRQKRGILDDGKIAFLYVLKTEKRELA